MSSSDLKRLAGQDFVSLTTFRRSGEGVPTPVWVALDADQLVVTTVDGTGKVKRIRRDGRVELVPCSRSGKVEDGAEPVAGTATVETGRAEIARLGDAIKAKYGFQYRAMMVVEKLMSRGRRERVILRITLV